MAEPARKLPEIETPRLPESKPPPDNIVDFNQYKYKRKFRQAQQATKQLTEEEIAKQYRQGTPMRGVSQSAGLTGGTGLPGEKTTGAEKPSAMAKAAETSPLEKKLETPPAPSTSTATPQPEAGQAAPVEEPAKEARQPQTRADFIRQEMARQRETIAQKKSEVEKTKKQHEEEVEQRSWKRMLSQGRLKRKKKELDQEEKRLERLGRILGIQQGSGLLLKASWLNLITTWGLSWFYIAFHFLAAYFTPFSNLFCKFGEEWLPKSVQQGPGGETAKQATKPLELIESCGCILIGLILLLIIFVIFLLVVIIAYAWENPLSALYRTANIAWEVIRCQISSCD